MAEGIVLQAGGLMICLLQAGGLHYFNHAALFYKLAACNTLTTRGIARWGLLGGGAADYGTCRCAGHVAALDGLDALDGVAG